MKNVFSLFNSLSIVFLLVAVPSQAQGPVDGFFNQKGKAAISLSYSYGNYDEFYVGGQKVGPVPAHNEVDQTIYSIFATYGLSDNLTLVASLPYIRNEGNGEPDPFLDTTEQSDFQDVSVYLKWAPVVKELDKGSVTYIAALGGSIPLGYEPLGIISVGTAAPGLDGKLGLQFNHNSGFFGAFIAGYGLRGNANGDIALDNGQTEFDAPDVVNAVFKLGYAGSHFYVDAWLDAQSSLSGVDIMGEGFFGNFPETMVNYTRVGANVYVPFTPFIGASAGFGTVVDGRNIGLTTYYSGGITVNL